MSGWIKWEKDIESDPRFIRMMRSLRVTHERDGSVTGAFPLVTVVVGALVRFWSYADSHIRENDTLDLGPDDIDAYVGVPGFAKSMPEDWLIIVDEGAVELPGYQEHNGVEAKKRDLAAKRQERRRSRLRNDDVTPVSDGSVTGALPDQTRPDQTREESAPRRNGSHVRGSRIPEDFLLTNPRREYAVAEGVDPERTFAKFRDYWRSATGKNAAKLDWDATWRNWVRSEAERNPRRPQKGGADNGLPFAN